MVEEITPEALKDRLDRGDEVQVVDIRPERTFEEGHIPGAENVPFDRFTQVIEDRDWSDDIVLVCPLGESSLQAARLLESYEEVDDDATVANLAGGYEEWTDELVTGSRARTDE